MTKLELALELAFKRGLIKREDAGHTVEVSIEDFIDYLEALLDKLK